MIEHLELKNLVCGVGNQLRYVDRFSTCRRNRNENVAEHQYFTAFFTLVICQHLKDVVINSGEAVTRALLHDVEEHYTGDIVRPVKHGSRSLKNAMEKAGKQFTHKFFSSLTTSVPVQDWMTRQWELAKDTSREGRVVRFADYLSVLAYLHQEVASGNKLVMENVSQLEIYAKTFDDPSFQFIRPLVVLSVKIIQEIYRDARSQG